MLATVRDSQGNVVTQAVNVLRLIWADEFAVDGPVDPNNWTVKTVGIWEGQLANFIDDLSVCRVEDGKLILETHYDAAKDIGFGRYVSSYIESKQSWLYGRFEASIKLPSGVGPWPAFWALPTNSPYGEWPDSGEIDIMEYWGSYPLHVYGGLHSKAYNWGNDPPNAYMSDFVVPTAETDFHLYAIEWDESGIDFYIDDIKRISYPNDGSGWEVWPFDNPFHLLLDLFLAQPHPWQGEIDNSAFPVRLEVDYVRVYQKGPTP